MSQITVSVVGGVATICVVPPPTTIVYLTVTFFNNNGEAFSGVSLKVTPNGPFCFDVRIPGGTDHGIVVDLSGSMEDALIKV